MSKTAFVRARVEPELKIAVEHVFQEWGVTTTQVINMLYQKIKRTHGLPAELFVPNAETERAIKEARAGKGVVKCKDGKDLFEKLGI